MIQPKAGEDPRNEDPRNEDCDDLMVKVLSYSAHDYDCMYIYIYINIYVYIYAYQGHRCDGKGCGKILVIDGNMKNHREVCFSKDAGLLNTMVSQGK